MGSLELRKMKVDQEPHNKKKVEARHIRSSRELRSNSDQARLRTLIQAVSKLWTIRAPSGHHSQEHVRRVKTWAKEQEQRANHRNERIQANFHRG